MSAINLTIDGINIEVPPGTTILQAARQLGVDIPTFCYDKELSANGACRICVVEVENARALVASCVAPVGPGMIIHTESERVINARKSILSLLIANHPLVCITCEKTGECKLQDYCYRYGITDSEFVGEVKELSLDDTNEFFVRDMNKCILCGICVGKCQDVVGAGAIDFTSRGFVTNVGPAFEDRIEDSTCVFCGLCIDSCPVGALTPKSKLGQGRPWQVELVKTICPYCSLGCGINLQVKDNKPIGVTPVTESPVNRGHLCIKGKFGWDYLDSEDRLTTPLIKSNGVFIEVSWEEALSYIVDNLDDIKTRYGADALMGLCSPKTGNEESYLFQKFIRSMGTNNVDSYTRHCHAPSVDGLMKAFGSAALTNSIEEIASAKTIFVIEADPLESHPILGYRIREAVRKGGQLILANHGHAGLTELANQYLQFKPGTAVALVNAMAQVIIEEGLTDKAFIGKRTEGFDAFTGHITRYTPAYAAKITGLTEEEIKTAARAYAGAETAAIVSKAGATESGGGTDLVLALANLALLTGNLGKESTGLYLPYGENNLQGCADMGGLPAVLPGYQTIREKSIRDKFSRSWGVQISDKPGLSAAEMFENPEQSGIKALYIMGENPVSCRHEDQKMVNFLKELEFLVVQDIFMTETASLADVILPAAAYGEKTVTYTNTERRVQISNAAVEPPGEAHPDWAIIAELAGWLGFEWEYGGPEDIMAEIASLVPQYAGISYERLIDHGLQWPCPTPGHSGTKYLYEGRFGRGLGLFSPVDFKPYVEEAVGSEVHTGENGEYPCSCLSESMTRRSVISVFKDSCNC